MQLGNRLSLSLWLLAHTSVAAPRTRAAPTPLQGNMGGGFTHFLMPLVFDGIKKAGTTGFMAWRWAFFVPASFQVLLTICTMLLAQDLPDGNYAALKSSGAMRKGSPWGTWKAALFNYRCAARCCCRARCAPAPWLHARLLCRP